MVRYVAWMVCLALCSACRADKVPPALEEPEEPSDGGRHFPSFAGEETDKAVENPSCSSSREPAIEVLVQDSKSGELLCGATVVASLAIGDVEIEADLRTFTETCVFPIYTQADNVSFSVSHAGYISQDKDVGVSRKPGCNQPTTRVVIVELVPLDAGAPVVEDAGVVDGG